MIDSEHVEEEGPISDMWQRLRLVGNSNAVLFFCGPRAFAAVVATDVGTESAPE